jgi:hypothetical protein
MRTTAQQIVHDVVVQVAHDADFTRNVHTIFNNDYTALNRYTEIEVYGLSVWNNAGCQRHSGALISLCHGFARGTKTVHTPGISYDDPGGHPGRG